MTRIMKKWMSAMLALFMLAGTIPATLAEEFAEEPAAVEEPVAVYSEPAPEPVAEVPAAEAPVEAAPVEEPSAEETPAEETPAEETPAEESLAETPAEDANEEPAPAQVFLVRLQLGETPNLIYVPYGTLEAELPLPGTLTALYSNGTAGEVSVNWNCLGDSLGGTAYVPNHENGAVTFYFQPTPVGALCDPAMMLPMVTVAYESVPMAVAENPNIEIADETITIALGAKVTTDDIANEPGYDASFLILNKGTIEAGSAELSNPIHGGTITGGVFRGDVNDAPQNVLRINGGTFYGEIGDVDDEIVDAYVIIKGGVFHGDVKARNLVVSGGTFQESSTVYLWTVGSIYGGTFYGTVINHLAICNGPETIPEFYGKVVNAQSPFGQIYGGRFYGEVDNSAGGKITSGAEFVNGTISNSGTIDAGDSTFSENVQIFNAVDGKILGGTFGCAVRNDGSISGGTYNGAVINTGMISGGEFYADMTNEGTIAGADLYGTLVANTGTISTEGVIVDAENGKVVISSGTSVTTDLILSAIGDERMGQITVIENNGKITGGDAEISCKIDNANGTIAGGSYSGYITGGTITGGTFNGSVNTDGSGIVSIKGGTFNGDIGNENAGYTFVSGGTFNAGVAARNLIVSGGTFNKGSNVVLGNVGAISGGSFAGVVTSRFSIEGGTFDGHVNNYGTIFGGTFNGTIDNYGEITYIEEYNLAIGFDSEGNIITRNQRVPQTWLNGTVSGKGGCIYGPVKYGESFKTDGPVYTMATVIYSDGSVKVYQGKEFLLNGNVLEGLSELDRQQNIRSVWTRADGSEIGAEDVFSGNMEENRFKRETFWVIRDGVLELETQDSLNNIPPEGVLYKSIHICAGVSVSDVSWNVPVVNDGVIAGGSFGAAVENNGAITGGIFNGNVVNNATITGAELNAKVTSNAGSRIEKSIFGEKASFQGSPAGYVELNYTADGETYYGQYNTQIKKALDQIGNKAYSDWYVYNAEGKGSLVSSSTLLTLTSRVFRTEKRATPEIAWPTAGALSYGDKLSSSKLTSTDRFGTFSWKTPNFIPAEPGVHSFIVVYKPTYPNTYDYSDVALEKEIEVEIKRGAAVIVISNGQWKYYGDADPSFGVAVNGLKNGDKLNYTIKREPGENVGTYKITAELGDNPNYDVTVSEGKFKIEAKPIAAVTTDAIANQICTGAALTPKPVVKNGESVLTEGTDYTLAYANNVNVGTATVTLTGKGNYIGTKTLTFLIEEAPKAVVTGWQKVDGKWNYYSADGVMQTGWVQVGKAWYYLDDSGVMQTGWQKIGSKWYYFNAGGAMVTGWLQIGGKWYYLNAGGAMVTGWLQNSGKWYYLSSSGAMVTGWVQVNSKWYYLSSGGAMLTGWVQVNGKWYYLSSGGAMVTGWVQVNGKWYYLSADGVMQTGWQTIGGKTYYLNASGAMLTGKQTINGTVYTFSSSGALQS